MDKEEGGGTSALSGWPVRELQYSLTVSCDRLSGDRRGDHHRIHRQERMSGRTVSRHLAGRSEKKRRRRGRRLAKIKESKLLPFPPSLPLAGWPTSNLDTGD